MTATTDVVITDHRVQRRLSPRSDEIAGRHNHEGDGRVDDRLCPAVLPEAA
jgi:hypothetical protein